MTDFDRELYAVEVERHVLALRECLIRHDENEKALHLLESVPYFIEDRPKIKAAIADQRRNCAHLLDPAKYVDYYANNPHERPFEEMYGIPAAEADKLPRVAWLRQKLRDLHGQHLDKDGLHVLDLACNDGMLAAVLAQDGHRGLGVDLNPRCIERARNRGIPGWRFHEGNVLEWFRAVPSYPEMNDVDAAVAFELIEHVPDPALLVETLCYGDRIFISTPNGAVERGNVPGWNRVEYKGHVRVYTPESLSALVSDHAEVLDVQVGEDNVILLEAAPR